MQSFERFVHVCILTCELGLPVSKFVLNHFLSRAEQNGVQFFLFKRLVHFKLVKFERNFFFKIFHKRAERN